MKIQSVWVFAVFLAVLSRCFAQDNANAPQTACNRRFCWSQSEVDAQGDTWFSEGTADTLRFGVALRCLKRFNVCILAQAAHHAFDEKVILNRIELLPVTHWDNEKITAKSEHSGEPCVQRSYEIIRTDRAVYMTDNPGKAAGSSRCGTNDRADRTNRYRLQ